MYRAPTGLVLTASDVVNHLACAHLSALELRNLDEPLDRSETDAQLLLLQRKGEAWERDYLERQRPAHPDLVEIPRDLGVREQAAATRAAMGRGASLIYQGALEAPGWFGRADFLRRVESPSQLGAWSYEVLDTKLARDAKASHVLQLCFYSWLVAQVQGAAPVAMSVVLGDGTERGFRYADYSRYFDRLRQRLAAFVAAPPATYPDPCDKCGQCRWSERCEAQRTADDHLCQVAGITKRQIGRLTDAGIATLTALATAAPETVVPSMATATFGKVRAQAELQHEGRTAGRHIFGLRELTHGRGFLRLPPPSAGDLYFDMEGDPLHEDGLEYLFGVAWFEGETLQFRSFWGHTRTEERAAFESFMDFVAARLAQQPDLHIYHYAAYENSALKRLMSLHGTREDAVDELLRQGRLVDLYRVVSEALIASTPGYSIKDIEAFYRPERTGEVRDAGASIVAYEHWRERRDPALLDAIERYNRDDCESTAQLHRWLLSIRPVDLSGAQPGPADAATERKPESADKAARRAQREALAARLVEGLPPDRTQWMPEHRLRELTAQLLDFHQRCDKPVWWKIFECRNLSEEELIEDLECVGSLVRVAVRPPVGRARLPQWECEYPEQDFKTRDGDTVKRVDTLADVTVISVDEARRRLVLRPSTAALQHGETLSLTPKQPINNDVLREAVMRFAARLVAGEDTHRAVRSLLCKGLPRLRGHTRGTALVARSPARTADIIDAVAALDESALFIQGPPGAGKTWTGSHVIVELIRRGMTVGISSNSHKAINNLLGAVMDRADGAGVAVHAVKKVTEGQEDQFFHHPRVRNETSADRIAPGMGLVAGTAWLFADPKFEQAFDYLFVDEAGQVSLGNLVAMGLAARNIVLMGDQMQLQQPIQGVHPGRSGESALEYLLEGAATIAPEHGIFLANTWRMHPELCRFVSEAVYDGRLSSAPGCERQALLLGPGAHAALRPTGIRFVPVTHEGCSQRSPEEVAVVRTLFANLLEQRWTDRHGVTRPMTPADILIVAPFNLQVKALLQALPSGARVGTVDRFQGQEAAVVLVSLATSSGADLPRNIEFLYSRNRLNVALSRARCLAVVVASPALLEVECRTAGQISLVNTLCWVEEYARGAV